jgi:hypothetical protein
MSKQQLAADDHREDHPDTDSADLNREELRAQVDVLTEENDRLRRAYHHSKQKEYRYTAFGFVGIGLLCTVGAIIFPDSQQVLFALAGCGLFGAVLTYFLTPERVIPASVSERIYSAFALSNSSLSTELGLQDEAIYIPSSASSAASFADVRLFRPQHTEYQLPTDDELTSTLVVTENELKHGLLLYPTGAALLQEFHHMTDEMPSEPGNLADQLTESLAHGFELVDAANADYSEGEDQVTISITESSYGSVTRFDHPIPSFLATGFAASMQTPVSVETIEVEDDRFDYLITCTWSNI